MLARLYTFIFLFTMVFSLWYQKSYLDKSTIEFNAQLVSKNEVLPVMTGEYFRLKSYENGLYKSDFSGDNIVYYSNKHFEIKNNLIYKETNSLQKKTSQFKENNIIVNTDFAFGNIINSNPNSAEVLMAKSKLKDLNLPHTIYFNIDNNIGFANNIYVDVIQNTLNSEMPFESKGPEGNIKGVGFFYSITEGSFKIKSKVNGFIIPTQFIKE